MFYSALPIVTYWVVAIFFHALGENDNIRDGKPLWHHPKNQLVTVEQTLMRVAGLHLVHLVFFSSVEYGWHDFGIPVQGWSWFKFVLGILWMDTMQYWTHRMTHAWPWLYRVCHKTHHEMKLPWSFAALYNSWPESTWLSALFLGVGIHVFGFTLPEFSWIIAASYAATVLDHTDGLHRIGFKKQHHLIHHETDIHSNFQQPFFTFWDDWMGTRRLPIKRSQHVL